MPVPEQLGKYRIEAVLGGHMCQVVRARDMKLGRTVALKILLPGAEAESRDRLLAEARISSRLRHQNLIQVLDFGEEDGFLFLVMELLEGSTLKQALADGRVVGLDDKLRIAREVASALAYIHANRIIHRDVKPENIYLDSTGEAKLMDFGVAKFEGLQLTAAGFTLGTPYYMAPEQVRGDAMTPLIDVYSFGITLYEMLTGIRPVNGSTVERIFDEILHDPLDVWPVRAAQCPEWLVALVERCTAKEPERRPQSFIDIAKELAP